MPTEMVELFGPDGESRGFYDPRNRLNDLTGKEWVFATRSVISKAYPPSFQFDLRNRHGGQKPPELCADLIRTFSKRGQRVLDPFMGVGGTLIGATITGREAVGVEIEPRWVDIYHRVCELEGLEPQQTYVANCLDILPTLQGPFDFVLTDVPYWNMDTARRSKGRYKRYGEEAQDGRLRKNLARFNGRAPLGRQAWLNEMERCFTLCRTLLRAKGYCAVFVGDMYQDGRYHLLSAELAERLQQSGWILKADLIWYDVGKQLHLYGYRYAFIPSIVHQHVLILRNE